MPRSPSHWSDIPQADERSMRRLRITRWFVLICVALYAVFILVMALVQVELAFTSPEEVQWGPLSWSGMTLPWYAALSSMLAGAVAVLTVLLVTAGSAGAPAPLRCSTGRSGAPRPGLGHGRDRVLRCDRGHVVVGSDPHHPAAPRSSCPRRRPPHQLPWSCPRGRPWSRWRSSSTFRCCSTRRDFSVWLWKCPRSHLARSAGPPRSVRNGCVRGTCTFSATACPVQ